MQRTYSLASTQSVDLCLKRAGMPLILASIWVITACFALGGCGGAASDVIDDRDSASDNSPQKQYEFIDEIAEPSASDLLPPAADEQVELRVLLITIGDEKVDAGRQLMEQLLKQLGVPYDVLDSSREDLAPKKLRNGKRGRYNGIIITRAETLLPDESSGFDMAEFEILFDYEREYGVREAVLTGFPVSDEESGINYGMEAVEERRDVVARWTNQKTDLFAYVNSESTIPIPGLSFGAVPNDREDELEVTPLLVDDDHPDEALVSHIAYADGREVLFSSINQGDWLFHSQLMAYEFLNFATSGLFIGARQAYLIIHNDDLFLPDALWNPKTNENFPEDEQTYRLTAKEVELVVEAQNRFRDEHPLASEIFTQLAFNAVLADDDDPLTQAIVEFADHFGFINHTYEALQLDRTCGISGPAGCPRTPYETIYDEIEENAKAWEHFGFPDAEFARFAMLPDSHSGLMDRNGTEDPDDDVPFPWGFNPAFGEAAEALAIKVIAGDHSRLNQSLIRRIPDFDLVLLPRYPTSVYYNVTTPAEMTAEYNYVHHYRYLEEDEDPCEIADAVCKPQSYEQILAAEADAALRHVFSYAPFPHYFHQSNLHTYDDDGHILQFDWQDEVLEQYARWSTLPLKSPSFHELAALALNIVAQREAGAAGLLDLATGEVTLVARHAAAIQVTGLSEGDIYGGQSQRWVELSQEPQTFTSATADGSTKEEPADDAEPADADEAEQVDVTD